MAIGTFIDAASTSVGVFAETDLNGFQWRTDIKRRERGYYFLDQSGGSASSAKHANVNDIYGISINKNWSTFVVMITMCGETKLLLRENTADTGMKS